MPVHSANAPSTRHQSVHAFAVGAFFLALGCEPERGSDSNSLDAAVAVSSNALSDPPDPQCAVATYNGHEYWFCRQLRNWSAARTRCQSEPGMDLARIDSAAENAFVFSNTPIDAWIGASDTASEGAWRWSNNGDQFWSGGAFGSAVGGRYANWKWGQPDNWFNQDCAAMELLGAGQWADRACTELLEFVCERPLDVGEPGVDCALDTALENTPWPGFRRCPTHQGTSPLVGAQDAEPYLTYEPMAMSSRRPPSQRMAPSTSARTMATSTPSTRAWRSCGAIKRAA